MGDAGRVAGGGLRNAPGFDNLDEGTSTVRETEKVQQDGSEVKAPETSEPPPTNPFPIKNQPTGGDTRKGEMFLLGQLMQAQLKAGPYSPPDPTPDSVIKDSTVGGKLDTDKLAKEMLKAAETGVSPKKFINETFDKLPKADRDKVARAMEKNLTDTQLKKLRSSFDGQEVLGRIINEYSSKDKTDLQKMARLHNAKMQGSFESTMSYRNLSPTGRKAVLDELQKDPTHFSKNESLVELAKSLGFARMSDATRKELFKYVEDNLGRPEFLKGLNQIVDNEAFQKLGDTERSKVLKDLWNFTQTPNYQRVLMETDKTSAIKVLANNFPSLNEAQRKTVVTDLNKFMKTKTYINMSNPDKDYALRLIGDLSTHSAKNPTFTTAKNTLNQFLNEKISMKFVNFGKSNIAAQADDGLMLFNIAGSGRNLMDPDKVVEITAHEVNHILNGKTAIGTSERFLDEYRAYYMSRSALGENPPKADHMKRALKSLVK